jgi:hypothetical protein
MHWLHHIGVERYFKMDSLKIEKKKGRQTYNKRIVCFCGSELCSASFRALYEFSNCNGIRVYLQRLQKLTMR